MILDNFDKMVLTLGNFSVDTVGMPVETTGGIYEIVCENSDGSGNANYGGGTLTFQTSLNSGGWQDVYASDGTLLEINDANDYSSMIRLNKQMQVRATLAGATSPDLIVKLV